MPAVVGQNGFQRIMFEKVQPDWMQSSIQGNIYIYISIDTRIATRIKILLYYYSIFIYYTDYGSNYNTICRLDQIHVDGAAEFSSQALSDGHLTWCGNSGGRSDWPAKEFGWLVWVSDLPAASSYMFHPFPSFSRRFSHHFPSLKAPLRRSWFQAPTARKPRSKAGDLPQNVMLLHV